MSSAQLSNEFLWKVLAAEFGLCDPARNADPRYHSASETVGPLLQLTVDLILKETLEQRLTKTCKVSLSHCVSG